MPLTEEDKQWFSEQLGHVESRFSSQLEGLETRFASGSKSLETEFSSQLENVGTRFSSQLEGLETRLLTEFHKWASPVEIRQRSHAAAIRAMDVEIESLGDRVKNLESPN